MNIGNNIRYYRKLAGLTQGQLAELINIKQYALAKYELGTHSPKPEMLFEIAQALKIEVQYLYGNINSYNGSIKLPKASSRLGQLIEAFENLKPADQRAILKQTKALGK